MDLLEDEDFEKAALYIEPPDSNWLSDEDSGEEDAVVPDNLPRSLLLAPAEIDMDVGSNNKEGNEEHEFNENDQEVSFIRGQIIKSVT